MDTPFANSLFRSLFHHRPCVRAAHAPSFHNASRIIPRRTIFALRPDAKVAHAAGEWQQKSPFLQIDMTEEFKRYPMVTTLQLSKRRERPKRVKMLVRDYIDGGFSPPKLRCGG
jgi:hypothetical protein